MKNIIILLIIVFFLNSSFCLGQQGYVSQGQMTAPKEEETLLPDKGEGKQQEAEKIGEGAKSAFSPVLKIEKTDNNLFSIELRDVEIADLVRVLAYDYKLNIILDKDVKGKVTASFYNIKIEDALENILASQGYSFVKENTIYRVKRALQTRVFKLNYISASKVLGKATGGTQVSGGTQATGGMTAAGTGQVSGGGQAGKLAQGISSDVYSLLSQEGKIFYGEGPNSFLVIDYPENISQIENYIKMIDVRPQQVLVEARVVEVKLQKEHALGVNWRLFAEKGGLKIGKYTIGSIYPGAPGALAQAIGYKGTHYPPGETTPATLEDPFTLSIFHENINVVLKALANSLDTNILSAPRITTINNSEAEIKVLQSLPWAEPQVSMNDVGIAVTWTIHFEEVGIFLKVTPVINEDGKITMTLNPEVSEKVSDYPLSVVQGLITLPYTVPVIDRRSASTNVVIGNGETLIIGGLIKDRTTKGVTKVPLLGDMPYLGNFFKSTKDTKDKTELLIFVSPTIITPEESARMARQERYGVGKGYTEDRERDEQAWLVQQALEKTKEDQRLLKLGLLEKRQKDLLEKRKMLEVEVIKGGEELKKIQNISEQAKRQR